MLAALIYKIADAPSWAAATVRGFYLGSHDDIRDGFIHFSTRLQARETAAKHFGGRNDLVVAAIDVTKLGAALKWEPSRGGALFPHLYASLPMSAVLWTRPLPLDRDGRPVFPPEMM